MIYYDLQNHLPGWQTLLRGLHGTKPGRVRKSGLKAEEISALLKYIAVQRQRLHIVETALRRLDT